MVLHYIFCYYKHKMNPQDPQQSYGQPAYVPPNPNQTPQPNPMGGYAVVPHPTPTPGQGNGGHNPYEFILSPDASAKKPSLGGGSVLKRVLIIVGLLVILTIIGTVVASFLMPKDNTGPQMIAVAQEQQEVVRVAGEVAQNTTSSELRNLAVTTQMSVDTNRQATVRYMTDRKIKIDDKILALKQNAETDKSFQAARSTNTFDTVAAQALNEQLVAYQANLKKAYAATTGKKARALLQTSYDTASALVTQSSTTSN